MGSDGKVPFVRITWEKKAIEASATYVEVEDHDVLMDRAIIEFSDTTGLGTEVLKEGQTIQIDMGWNSEHAVLFEGITKAPSGKADGKGKTVRIMAVDLSDKLHRKVHSDSYTGKLSEIVTKLVKAQQIEIGKIAPDPDPSFDAKKPLMHTNETDLQFIQRMARRYRARAFVEYNDGKSKFYFIPLKEFLSVQQGTMKYCQGMNQLIEFKYQKIAARADSLRDDSRVDPMTGEITNNPAPTPKPPDPVKVGGETSDKLSAAGASDKASSAEEAASGATEKSTDHIPQLTASGGASDPEEAQLANQQDPTRAMGLFANGTVVGTINLRAKGTVKIQGIAQWAEGDWYVGVVKHIYRKQADNPLYHTKFVATR